MKFVAFGFGAVIFLLLILLLNPAFYYNIGILLYRIAIGIASLWNNKAKQWLAGRKNLFADLHQNFNYPDHKKIWVHCASLGEFEQGRPLIELLRSNYPQHKILLTFYSPSGYTIRKDFPAADYVTYLPLDTKSNAAKFIDIVKPDLAVFVKYEFWLNFIKACERKKVPLYLISSVFKKRSVFFRWYGRLFRSMLRKFTYIYVQDKASLELLKKHKITNAEVAADTRFDRVMQVASQPAEIEGIEAFKMHFNLIVAGSTWPEDERILKQAFYKNLIFSDFKLVIAPHNISEKDLKKTRKKFKDRCLTYTEFLHADREKIATARVLIMDNMGMLSSLYRYADICYIGGGFNKGIHNILEAAVYGKPVLFGTKYKKVNEAVELIEIGSAFCVWNAEDILKNVQFMGLFDDIYKGACNNAATYVVENSGGTQKVFSRLQTNI